RRGGDLDNWDLEVRSALFNSVRMHSAVEEHGGGKQLIRFRVLPTSSILHWVLPVLLVSVSVVAALNNARAVAIIIALLATLIVLRIVQESAIATGVALRALYLMKEALANDVRQPASQEDSKAVSPETPSASTAVANPSVVERKENVRAHA